MEVLSIEEQRDGSAIVELLLSREEQNLFIEVGVLHCLKESITNFEKEFEKPKPTRRKKGKI